MRVVLFFIIFFSFIFAESIERFDVALTLDDSGEIVVQEDIHYDFGNQQRRGIFRDIPVTIKYQNKGIPIDIGLSDVTVTMDNQNVRWRDSYHYSSTQGKMLQIKIGDPTIYLSNLHHYRINYRVKTTIVPYNFGDDTLRWNLIGDGWKVPIDKADFHIHLPPSLPKNHLNNIHLFYGKYGSTQSAELLRSKFIEWHSDYHFSFSLAHFKAHQGATIEIVFPKGILTQSGDENILYANPTGSESIAHYDVTLRLNQAGSLNIREEINYNFGYFKRHGIYRDIPSTIRYQGKGHPIDLGLHNFTVSMDDKSVKWYTNKWKSSHWGNTQRIKIGSYNIDVTGLHRYTIGYDVKTIILPFDETHDTMRWNLIGKHWKTSIENSTFDIHLPPTLSQSTIKKINVFYGTYGSTKEAISSKDIKWYTPQHFSFTLSALKPYQGVTVEVVFPTGLLDASGADTIKEPLPISLWRYLQIPLIILLGFYLFNWAKRVGLRGFFNRSYPPYYYPPKELSILQANMILQGKSKRQDIFPALLELAQLGCITIHNSGKKPYIQKNEGVDEEALTYDQKRIMKALFKNREQYKFTSLRSSMASLNRKIEEQSIQTLFSKKPFSLKWIFFARAFLGFILLFSIASFISSQLFSSDVAVLSVAWTVMSALGLWGLIYSLQARQWVVAFFALGWLLSFGGMIFVIISEIPSIYDLYMTPIFPALIVMPLTIFLMTHIHPLNQQGLEYYTQIMGLKKFIKQVDRDRIEEFLKQDPDYMDRLLPYATLFDLTDHWIELSSEVLKENYHPSWYDGTNIATIVTIASTLNAQTQPIYSSSSSSSSYSSSYSGGGFSGGGSYSGGGGGGGGGGSW